MALYLPNGIGESLGDSLATSSPLIMSGQVWWVDSQTGTDAASPAGRNREKPLATLSQALTNAAHEDIIVCKSGHTETLTAGLAISKRIVIVGAGASAGRPTVKFTNNSAADNLLTVSANNVELRNIWFEEQAQANSATKIFVDAAVTGFRMVGCYLEANDNDNGPILSMDAGADEMLLENCTFISTATTITTQPLTAIRITGAISNFRMKGCVLSDGTVGWSNVYAFDGAAAITGMRIEELSLLLGAEMTIEASSTGHIGPVTQTGGAKVNW